MGVVEKTAGSTTEEGGRHKNEMKATTEDGDWMRTEKAAVDGRIDCCEADSAD